MLAKKKCKPGKFEKKVLNRPDWDKEDNWDGWRGVKTEPASAGGP
jgi:hypothetical protein